MLFVLAVCVLHLVINFALTVVVFLYKWPQTENHVKYGKSDQLEKKIFLNPIISWMWYLFSYKGPTCLWMMMNWFSPVVITGIGIFRVVKAELVGSGNEMGYFLCFFVRVMFNLYFSFICKTGGGKITDFRCKKSSKPCTTARKTSVCFIAPHSLTTWHLQL